MATKDNSVYRYLPRFAYRQDIGQYFYLAAHKLLVRTRDGVSNPYWQSDIRLGRNAATNMTGFFDDLKHQRAVVQVTHRHLLDNNDKTVYYSHTETDGAAASLIITTTPSAATVVANNRALVAFRKHMNDALSKFKGLTFIGELGESIKMIKHPAQALQKLARTYLNNVKKARQINGRTFPRGTKEYYQWKRNLSGLWLEQAFGWQPLIADIGDAFTTYKSLRDRKDTVQVRGYGLEEKLLGEVGSVQYFDAGMGFIAHDYKEIRKSKAFVKYYGLMNRSVSASIVDSLGAFGFRAEEFIPTVWELLPWSFLIDYFSNIGDVITAGATSNEYLSWANQDIVQLIEYRCTASYNKAISNVSGKVIRYHETPAWASLVRRKVTRNASINVNYPTLSFEFPGSSAQWANMLALFGQAGAISPQRSPFKRGRSQL